MSKSSNGWCAKFILYFTIISVCITIIKTYFLAAVTLAIIGVVAYLYFSKSQNTQSSHTYHVNTPKYYKANASYNVHIPTVQIINPKADIRTKKWREECKREFVVLDFETTGLSPYDDKIVEVAAIRYKNLCESDKFETLVNPKIRIPRRITDINGITDAMVKNSPTIEQVIPKLINFIGESVIVAHNAPFDMKFLIANADKCGLEFRNSVVDTLPLSRKIYPGLENHKLGTIAEHLGIRDTFHRGVTDARAAGRILIECIRVLDSEDINHANERERSYDKNEMYVAVKEDYEKPFEYDPIDDDIYKCFVSGKTGMCDAIGSWEKFYQVEEKIADICQTKGGKYYKSQAKGAKFAILFSYINRTHSSVTTLREKGYKVTSFENAIHHLGLSHMWDTKKLSDMVKSHREFIIGHYDMKNSKIINKE